MESNGGYTWSPQRVSARADGSGEWDEGGCRGLGVGESLLAALAVTPTALCRTVNPNPNVRRTIRLDPVANGGSPIIQATSDYYHIWTYVL